MALSETEIFDCLLENLTLAAEASDRLAVVSMRGDDYTKLRECLALCEGACRQAGAWRDDTRWLPIGKKLNECHDKAGGWLRGRKIGKQRIALAGGERNTLFDMLAKNLRFLRVGIVRLKDERTGQVGLIMPAMQDLGRPQGMLIKGGIILPESMRR